MFAPDELWSLLEANEKDLQQGLVKELLSERARQNLTMVHKVQVTPTRIIFNGPEPEAKNRILRKFPRHIGYFARVQFCDEDGLDLYFNSKGKVMSQQPPPGHHCYGYSHYFLCRFSIVWESVK
jgi:hypothetical protein